MYKSTILISLALLLINSSNIFAQEETIELDLNEIEFEMADHLQPVRGFFSAYKFQFEYYIKIRKTLFEGLSDSPFVRFQVMPSFTPENVLDIEYDRETNQYYLIYQIGEQMIWKVQDWKNNEIKKYKKTIDKSSAELIKSLFEKAILQTKYAENEIPGTDGTDYYFSIDDFGTKTGMVWSPTQGSLMGRLVAVGQELIRLTKSAEESISFDKEFINTINKINNELATLASSQYRSSLGK